VDRLSIVAHDRFEEIVDAANRPDSIIRASFKISAGAQAEHKKIVQLQPVFLQRLGIAPAQESLPIGDTAQVKPLFITAGERAVAQATIDVIQRSFSRQPVSYLASDPATQAAVLKEVAAAVTPKQGELAAVVEQPRIAEIVRQVTALLPELVIQIPRIIVVPKGDTGGGFRDFDLNVTSVTQQPVSDDVLVQVLTTNEQIRVKMELHGDVEDRLEDYVVRHLIDKDDIDYDQHADLLYKLAGQLVAKLRSYLPDDAAVQNVVKYSQLNYAELIYQQMQAHYFDNATEWEARVSPGFNELRGAPVSIGSAEALRDFHAPVDEKQDIRSMYFGGFRKCLYASQKFDSDSERRLSVVLEQDDSVLKWFKPVNDRDIRIHLKDGSTYRPDFVVETKTAKFLCEPKMRKELDNQDVKDKAQAAVTYCKHATEQAQQGDGKKWRYLLIPHDAITANMTLEGLASRFTLR
jgi:type III restriction enzyme